MSLENIEIKMGKKQAQSRKPTQAGFVTSSDWFGEFVGAPAEETGLVQQNQHILVLNWIVPKFSQVWWILIPFWLFLIPPCAPTSSKLFSVVNTYKKSTFMSLGSVYHDMRNARLGFNFQACKFAIVIGELAIGNFKTCWVLAVLAAVLLLPPQLQCCHSMSGCPS